MKTKPFDLEAAKRGEKVVTRDGRDARIICYDRRVDNELGGQIVALVLDAVNGHEDIESYTTNGSYYDTGGTADEDLFMFDESDDGSMYVAVVRSASGGVPLTMVGPFPEQAQAQEVGDITASKFKMTTTVSVMKCLPA